MQVKIHINNEERLSLQTTEFGLVRDILEGICNEMPNKRVKAFVLEHSEGVCEKIFDSSYYEYYNKPKER